MKSAFGILPAPRLKFRKIMGNTLSGNENGLLAYYQFNEGDGNTATDSSTNANDGTIYNDPQWVESSSKPVGTLIVTIQM
jgi:hypothetical protein